MTKLKLIDYIAHFITIFILFIKKIGNLLLNYTLNRNELINKEINLSVDINNYSGIHLYKKNNFIIINEKNDVLYMKKNL